jgi:hypothetical protein
MDRYLSPGNTHWSGNVNDWDTDLPLTAGDADTTTSYYECESPRDEESRGWN